MSHETTTPRLQHGLEILRNLSNQFSESFWRQLHEWGQGYVGSRFGHHLAQQECERITELAVQDALDEIFDPILPLEAKLSTITRALECQRQRHRRDNAKHTSIDLGEEPHRTLKGPDGRDEAEKFLRNQLLQAARQKLFSAFGQAMPMLEDDDYNRVVIAFGFDEVGFVLRGSKLSEEHRSAGSCSTEAMQKAMQRAKRRLRTLCIE